MSNFIALSLSIAVVKVLRPVNARLELKSPSMAKQLCDAAMSAPLNLAEGAQRHGKDQAYHYTVATGSAAEARTNVELAKALGWLDGLELRELDDLQDRQAALLHRLLHPRRCPPSS